MDVRSLCVSVFKWRLANSHNLQLLQCCYFLKRDTCSSSICLFYLSLQLDFCVSVPFSPLNLPSLFFCPPSYLPEDGYVRMFLRGRPVTMHVPDQQRESYSLDHKMALPDHKLKLQWVYPSDRERDTDKTDRYTVPLMDQEGLGEWMRN